jgi:hypothetical protein
MLGLYEHFPETIHKTARFATRVSTKRLQQTLVQTFHETNTKTFKLEDVADPSVPRCTVIFEFGIAEANNFDYLDDEETMKVLKVIQEKPLQVIDVYCALRYYKTQDEKKTPLKFDYYMIRLVFNKNLMETQVFHERGLGYATPEDVINFIAGKINEMFSKKILKPLKT